MDRILTRIVATVLATFVAVAAVAQDQTRVVAVNYPLQYFAERLLDNTAQVDFLVPDGVDPSFWRPSVADISAIQSADLILLNGASFATWVDRVSLPRSKLINTSAAFSDQIIQTESITHSHGEGDEHSHEGTASYVWLDPSLAIAQSEAIAQAIVSRGLAAEEEVAARLETLRAELTALEVFTREAFAGLENVAIVTTHPRYQYLARAFDLEVHALEWEAGETPDAAAMNDLEVLMAQHDAGLLIWEAPPPAAAIEAVGALGLKSATFAPLAQRPQNATFFESFRASVTGVEKAAEQVTSN